MSEITSDSVPAAAREHRTSPPELLWDLVFVFAVTQVTTLLSHKLSWEGLGESMLVLALIWWAWSAFVWASNAHPEDSPVVLGCLLTATLFILICGLALPAAFTGQGTLFAVTYAIVRLLHLALYADASRQGNATWSSIAGFALTVLIGMALLIGGSFAAGLPRAILWLVAAAIDYAGPGWLTRQRLRDLQRVAVAHFAERYGLFVIICLGESIVAIGVGARRQSLSASLVAAVLLGLLITIGLWWSYFVRLAEEAEAGLRVHEEPVLAAADAYSYLHLVIVAGIIIFAVGASATVRAIGSPLNAAPRLALCGGVALYLLGLVAFRLRLLGELSGARVGVAGAMLVLFGVGGALPAWSLAVTITVVLAILCVGEAIVPDRP